MSRKSDAYPMLFLSLFSFSMGVGGGNSLNPMALVKKSMELVNFVFIMSVGASPPHTHQFEFLCLKRMKYTSLLPVS